MFRDLKYLFAYVAPLSAIVGFHLGGWWYYAAFVVGFILIPVLETFLAQDSSNHLEELEDKRANNKIFDFLIYLNFPLLFYILYLFLHEVNKPAIQTYELIGLIASMTVILGALGINVAHELGHRENKLEVAMARAMLMPSLYMHFNISHNLGHHKNVATDLDPSSAKLGQTVYNFWLRSSFLSYLEAWQLENARLKRAGRSPLSFQNQMIWFQIIQIGFLFIVYYFFGTTALLAMVSAAIGGFLLLESVNYIEHYGLRRKQLESGRYEPATFKHSWNSNHELGRIFLYELTRHSDHHFKTNRKYQLLRHFDESPQLPYGYPASIIISLIPPLWFRIMNNRVQAI